MLEPSYRELMDVLNKDGKMEEVASRYAVVIAVSKRARQIIDGDPSRVEASSNKAVSMAMNEMRDGLITAYPDEEVLILEEATAKLEDFDKGKYQSLDDALEAHIEEG